MTIRPVLRAKPNKQGHLPIYLRISDGFGDKYISLGQSIHSSMWNPKRERVRRSHPNSEAVNALIDSRLNQCQAEILASELAGDVLTVDDLSCLLRKPRGHAFNDYAWKAVERYKERGQLGTHDSYRAILRRFEDFAGQVRNITPTLLRDYETYLIGLGRNRNTVSKHIGRLRSIYRQGIQEGIFKQQNDPFVGFKVQGQKVNKIHLEMPTILALERLELSGRQALARDSFLFSFYALGMRFGDVCRLKWDHVGSVISYTMVKTGEIKRLPLLDSARKIIDQYQGGEYVFPFLEGADLSTTRLTMNAVSRANANMNRGLGVIAKNHNLPKFSFHIARHSFAYLCQVRGMDVSRISEALGHSKIATTEHYLSSMTTQMDEEIRELYGG